MKPLVKYPITLFILFLIGYGQLFAPLFKSSFVYSPVKIYQGSAHFESPPSKGAEKETVYIAEEEDEERDSLKKYSDEYATSPFPYTSEYFTQPIKNGLSCYKSLFHSAFSRSPYLIFCVFRL